MTDLGDLCGEVVPVLETVSPSLADKPSTLRSPMQNITETVNATLINHPEKSMFVIALTSGILGKNFTGDIMMYSHSAGLALLAISVAYSFAPKESKPWPSLRTGLLPVAAGYALASSVYFI